MLRRPCMATMQGHGTQHVRRLARVPHLKESVYDVRDLPDGYLYIGD